MTMEVLSEVLSELEWPAPYTLEDELPDGIVMSFPDCDLFFMEGFESEMVLEFPPSRTGMDRSLTLDHALLALSPDPAGSGGLPTPGLINDRSPAPSVDKVKNGIRDLCKMVLTHLQPCILGDFSWVDKYKAHLARTSGQ